MVLLFRVWSCLLAFASGVAPPAIVPPPMQPAAMTGHVVVSQTPGNNAGMVAAPAANSVSAAQLAARLRGNPAMMPARASWNSESALMETLGSTPPVGAEDQFREVRETQIGYQVSRPSYAPTNKWESSLGALVLAAVAGAVAGGLGWRKRAQAVQLQGSATEMTASSSLVMFEQPKFAVAAVGSEFHGRGKWKYDPLSLSAPEHLPRYREAELKHGRVALAFAAAAALPQPATAAELTGDGFGNAELIAIFIPLFFVSLGYFEWESKQPNVDDITGPAVLGKTVDAAPNDPGAYFRRSPEYD